MMDTAPSAVDHHGVIHWISLLRIVQPVSILIALLCIACFTEQSDTSFRRRRAGLTALTVVALIGTYFVAGLLLVLRAVIPSDHQTWTPELPLWQYVDWQLLLNVVALGSLLILSAWQQRSAGAGKYSILSVYSAVVLGGVTDVLILIFYVSIRSKAEWKDTTPWTWAQLSLQATRIVLLWPVLLLLAHHSAESTYEAIPDSQPTAEANLAANTADAASSTPRAQPANERTGLLSGTTGAASATPAYGSAGPASTNGQSTPVKAAAQSTAASANASMGLTLAAQPPPPTFRVFFSRIVTLFPYLWPSKSLGLQSLALLCVALLVAGRFVNLAVPLLLGKIVDRLGGGGGEGSWDIWWLIGGYALLKCLQGSGGLLTVATNFAWLPLQQYSDRHMSLMAFRHLLDLSMSFHTKRKTGEVLRILDRGSSINNFFQYLIFSVAPIFFDIIIATIFLSARFGPQVGLLLFAIMTVYTAVSVKMTTWRTALRRQANNKDSVSRAIHTDVLLNWETVKSYNNENWEADRYNLSLRDYQGVEWKVSASLNMLNLVQNLILSTGTLLMLFVVAYDVVKGYASSSDFVTFLTYTQQIYGPLNMLSTLYRVIQTSLVDTDKLMALLQEEKDVKDLPGAKDLEVKDGIIEFKDVKFSYDGKVEALKGLSFTIKPKSKVALVGESGAGKSSVLRLLYRFYDPTSGQILIDGQDIRTVTQSSLRQAIGVVPQEAGLLNTSIRTNIGYGRTDPPASDEEIEAAAAAAQILEKIQSFTEGMDTVVGERGVRLSGGEKQRVAIARTFLKRPSCLLLDEPTSALDSQTERQLQTALNTLMEGKTSLTIAHRLSTIVNSDQIIVLNDGRVVEAGTHEELIAIPNGRYASMWLAQVETDKERVEKAKEKEKAGDNTEEASTSIDVPRGHEEQGEATSSAPQEPAAGMLGIVSPSSQRDTSVLQQAASEEYKIEEQEAKAPEVPSASALSSIDDDPSTSQQPEMLAPVSEGSREGSSIAAVEGDTTVAPSIVEGSISAQADKAENNEQKEAYPFPSEGTDAAKGTTATEDQSTSEPTTPGGGKFRQRIASLMKRSTSGTVINDDPSNASSPGAEGNSSSGGNVSPTMRRSLSNRSGSYTLSKDGNGGGLLSRSVSWKSKNRDSIGSGMTPSTSGKVESGGSKEEESAAVRRESTSKNGSGEDAGGGSTISTSGSKSMSNSKKKKLKGKKK